MAPRSAVSIRITTVGVELYALNLPAADGKPQPRDGPTRPGRANRRETGKSEGGRDGDGGGRRETGDGGGRRRDRGGEIDRWEDGEIGKER